MFFEKLNAAVKKNSSFLCIGLDPDPKRIPRGMSVYDFNKAIIDATSDLVCAYKPNIAFYEAMGDEGLSTLLRTREHVPPHIPVIVDAKRGDIGNTSAAYATALFVHYDFDATTVSPYLGFDSIEPFLQRQDKGIFILCRTSNPGASDFQSLMCKYGNRELPLFEVVADKADKWNKGGNIGLVVGATYPGELKLVRQAHQDIPILIPGVGAQGGDLALAVQYGLNLAGGGIIINSSRQIIFASEGKDFAEAARKAALTLRDEINKYVTRPAK